MINLIAIKTNDGRYYLSQQIKIINLNKILIDGETPVQSFHFDWVYVNNKPKKITEKVKQSDINHRFELQDKSLISKKLPEFLDREKVADFDDEFYDWIWKKDMFQYRSLYNMISDSVPDKEKVWDFNLKIILTIDKITNPSEIKYTVPTSQWKCDGNTTITEKNLEYQVLDKIIFPGIILPQRPCKLSSHQTYKIVRQYIKDNINNKISTVTSDFDFCFTVKRRIKLAKLYKYKVDVNQFSQRKRKPKFIEKEQDEKLLECFEMTYSPDNYKGYTPIEGFQAKNQYELKEKIDKYCLNLINFINTKLEECKHCNGDGIIISEKEDNHEKRN